jgi:hypothetical protein
MRNYLWGIAILLVLILSGFGLIFALSYYPQIFQSQGELLEKENLSPKEAVVVNFSFPALKAAYEGRIQIFPETAVDFQWKESFGNRKQNIKFLFRRVAMSCFFP